MNASFEETALAQFRAHPEWQTAHPFIWHVLTKPSSPHRSRQIARMEREARLQMGMGPHEAIDWSKVDWLRVLQWIVAIVSLLVLI